MAKMMLIGPVWHCVCDAFQRNNQKNPAKRSAADARSAATLNVISEQMNWERPKCEARGELCSAYTQPASVDHGPKHALTLQKSSYQLLLQF